MLKPSSSPASPDTKRSQWFATIAAFSAITLASLTTAFSRKEHGEKGSHSQHAEKNRHLLTLSELKEIAPMRLHWERMQDLLDHGLRCVDGRNYDEHGIEGVPGGDAGIILALVACLETELKRTLSQDEVSQIVASIPGTIYMHTSDHTLHGHEGRGGLLDVIKRDPVLGITAKTHDDAEKLLEIGTGDHRKNLILCSIASRSSLQGCGHLAKSGAEPEAYGIRKGLMEQVVSAVYLRKWQREEAKVTKIDPLNGDHEEGAVVEVVIPADTTPNATIPTLEANSRKGGGQVFVLGPKELSDRRLEQIADEIVKIFPEVDIVSLLEHAKSLFARQSGESAHRLANGLPHLIIKVDKEKRIVFEDAGTME